MKALRLAFGLLASGYGLLCALTPGTYRFLDGVDLVVHEAGHALFSVLGEFAGILGGSLMQLLVPVIAFVAFLRQRQRYSASIVLVWLAQSLCNVSVYVRDARARRLPLVGGDGVVHDWNYLLGTLGLLRWDTVLATAVYLLGLAALLAAATGVLLFSMARSAEAAECAR